MGKAFEFLGTESPWVVRPTKRDKSIFIESQHGTVCRIIDGDIFEPDMEHNARLIALAPELLEALVDLNTALDNYWNSPSKPDSLVKAISRQQQKCHGIVKRATNS